ncbi:Retrovirus-related Pol polyprotein from transposon TNT 1-94 [Dendrobium catenatum]|uniref:Retrovirus-related Pol polyprotein from transposon TNT 1-94 n=1 Tax=Dendrobium catenatum TaxID=906689 RepID=A0A2I0W2N2_9ASPA|nr:Retrovirus-related Pol polyprotein from transposon TNT 1-94 [Dendrobium catenatum]
MSINNSIDTSPSPSPADIFTASGDFASPQIPSSLKFLMNSIKNVTAQTLTAENHSLWRSQVLKLFRANGFDGFLTGSTPPPPPQITSNSGQIISNPAYNTWILIDQNLAAALYAIISPSILPYVLSVNHCSEIWQTLETRLQSCTRSRIAHLKNELHSLSMKEKTMTQYLLAVKATVDSLAAAGSPVDVEDVIHYTLNGLPNTYQAFKTAIRTNLRSMSLDELYTLLCSEELNIAHENLKDLQTLNLAGNQTALTANRGRGRGRSSQPRNKPMNRPSQQSNPPRGNKPTRPSITCQICGKFGHSAVKCWYRHDDSYATEPSPALFTTPSQATPSEWYLDSGASNHLTSDPNQIQQAQTYTGSSQVILGNGHQIPIHNTSKGILPTPTRPEDPPPSSHGSIY